MGYWNNAHTLWKPKGTEKSWQRRTSRWSVTPRTQNMSSTRDNCRAPIRRALQVCQALLTNSKKNDILGLKSSNKHINQ